MEIVVYSEHATKCWHVRLSELKTARLFNGMSYHFSGPGNKSAVRIVSIYNCRMR
jgi:hypothetical protein